MSMAWTKRTLTFNRGETEMEDIKTGDLNKREKLIWIQAYRKGWHDMKEYIREQVDKTNW